MDHFSIDKYNEAECMLERYIRNLKKENPYLKDELNFPFDLFYLK